MDEGVKKMIFIKRKNNQGDALLFSKKFKRVLGFKPIMEKEADDKYMFYVDSAPAKAKYDAAVKAGRL